MSTVVLLAGRAPRSHRRSDNQRFRALAPHRAGVLGQLPGPGPYRVDCPGSLNTGATFAVLRDALCWAQNVADFEDRQCAVTDRLGNSLELRRGSPSCPRPRPSRSPFPEAEPFFHPVPEHPRSRVRFLQPQPFVPVFGPQPRGPRPREFFEL